MAFIYDLTDTWNAGGTSFNAIKMNVTDTASAAASRLMTLQVGGAERFSVRKDGQAYFAGIVGIGTTSPGYQLDIASSETSFGYAMRLRSNPTATAAILQFTNSGVTQQNGVFGVTDAGLVTIQADGVSSAIALRTNGNERVRINSSGNVGIGTNNPQQTATGRTVLGVNGSSSSLINLGSGENFGSYWFWDGTATTLASNNTLSLLAGSSPILFSNNATERMRIDASGNVGIGTSSPATRLQVSAASGYNEIRVTSGANSLGLAIDASAAYLAAFQSMPLTFQTNSAERMRIDASGNIGVGTSTIAGGRMQINGQVSDTDGTGFDQGQLLITDSDNNTSSGLMLGYRWNAGVAEYARIQARNAAGATSLILQGGGGNVGIGTATPSERLDTGTGNIRTQGLVISANQHLLYSADANTLGLRIGAAGPFYGIGTTGSNNMRFNNASGGDMLFAIAGTERARITAAGDVGIGTSSPQQTASGRTVFGVNGSSSALINLGSSQNFGTYWFWDGTTATLAANNTLSLLAGASPILFSNSGVERARITSEGRLLVGTSSAFDNVSFLGTQLQGGVATRLPGTGATSQLSFFNDNGRVGFIFTDGTSTGYSTSSDERLKHDIVDAPEASDLIDAIKVRSFKWNADNSEQRYGFVAQELAEVAPEAVHQPDEDQMMGVDYSKLVPMLVKEIQCLRARMAQLEISASTITFEGN
jgi:hypothetical protein